MESTDIKEKQGHIISIFKPVKWQFKQDKKINF